MQLQQLPVAVVKLLAVLNMAPLKILLRSVFERCWRIQNQRNQKLFVKQPVFGLKEAKASLTAPPAPVKKGVATEAAEALKAQLEEVGYNRRMEIPH